MRKFHALNGLVAVTVLTGCGSDGGEGVVAQTAITEANAPVASAVVYQAASILFDVASSTGTLPLGVVAAIPAGVPGTRLGLASFAARELKSAMQQPFLAATGAVGVVSEETLPCTGGGTVTVVVDDADNNGIESIGDSFKLTFANCLEDGVTSNGVVSFNLTVLSGATTGAEVVFGSLTVNDGADIVGADGGFTLTVTENGTTSETYKIVGAALTATLNGDRHTLTAFTASAVTDLVAGTATYAFNGGVSDTSNAISVTAETVTAFVAQLAQDYPGSGTFRTIGAGNSQALLRAVSSTQVQISADPEGDGTFTAPVDWTWAALQALLD